VLGTVATVERRPARWSAVDASCALCPVTLGTTTDVLPFETCNTTCVPCCARLPGFGDCATTVPGGCDDAICSSFAESPRACSAFSASAAARPVRSGIPTPGRPFDTRRVTTVPCGTDAPCFGDWPTTIPFGFAAALRSTFDASFAWRNWNCADCTRMPVTFGTDDFDETATAAAVESWWWR